MLQRKFNNKLYVSIDVGALFVFLSHTCNINKTHSYISFFMTFEYLTNKKILNLHYSKTIFRQINNMLNLQKYFTL